MVHTVEDDSESQRSEGREGFLLYDLVVKKDLKGATLQCLFALCNEFVLEHEIS